MTEPAWTCPHCGGHDFRPSAADDRVGNCAACGFAYPSPTPATDGSTWRQQAQAQSEPGVPTPWVRADRYRVIRSLASGAQGRILLAHHRHLDQICVIKVIEVEEEWRELATARLQAEARAGVQVSHRNVARVLDCDAVDNVWYFVMEYVAGENLRTVVKSVGRLCWAQVVELGVQVAEGLAAIHAAGLIHRDLKPSNLMLRGDGVAKIMDLGLVKRRGSGADPALTRDGQILGTPFYMPPEQFDADRTLTPQADLYSLGATMYHLLAGRPPFPGSSVLDLANHHKRDPVIWADDLVRTVPTWLRHIVESCLAKHPDHRFASAERLLEALRGGQDVDAPSLAHGRTGPPRGILVTAFRNLSRRPEDEWIGEALAEYLSGRLLAVEGLHVVDRQGLDRLLRAEHGADPDAPPPNDERLLDTARLLGAGLVLTGSFQRSGDQLRIMARSIGRDDTERKRMAATVSGGADRLFSLEDELAEQVFAQIGADLVEPAPPRRSPWGTESIEAHERFIRGRRAFADGDYRHAIALAEEALGIDPEYIDAVSLAGACFARIGDYDRALVYHQREEAAARHEGDVRRLAESLGNLGVMYYYQGEYGLAYEFLREARDLAVGKAYHPDVAKYEGNLGFVLMRLNRYPEAEASFAQAIDINKKYGDLVALAWPYNGMGGVLLRQQRYAEAREYYQRALGLAREIGDRVNSGIGHMNLGRCACLLGDFAEAEACFDEALTALNGTDFWNGLTLVYGYLADMYLQENNTKAALDCIDHRLELAQKHHNHRLEAEAWEQRAKAFQLAGDTEQAFACLKRSLEVAQRPPPHESLHRYLSEITKRQPFG